MSFVNFGDRNETSPGVYGLLLPAHDAMLLATLTQRVRGPNFAEIRSLELSSDSIALQVGGVSPEEVRLLAQVIRPSQANVLLQLVAICAAEESLPVIPSEPRMFLRGERLTQFSGTWCTTQVPGESRLLPRLCRMLGFLYPGKTREDLSKVTEALEPSAASFVGAIFDEYGLVHGVTFPRKLAARGVANSLLSRFGFPQDNRVMPDPESEAPFEVSTEGLEGRLRTSSERALRKLAPHVKNARLTQMQRKLILVCVSAYYRSALDVSGPTVKMQLEAFPEVNTDLYTEYVYCVLRAFGGMLPLPTSDA